MRYRVEVLDGTTTALELEGGTVDVDRWYDARAGTSIINHGVSIGHDQVRMQVMHDPGKDTPIGPAKSRAGTERRGIGLSKLHAHDALHTVLILCNTKSRPPANSPEAPSLKLATNTPMYQRMTDDMDINCGEIVDGTATVQGLGEDIFKMILATASGKRSKSEELGYGDDEFVPWVIGATM